MPAPYNTTDNPNPFGRHPGGAPGKYATAEELQPLIDKYFAETDKNDYTMTGLAEALDFTSRKQLIEYAEKPEFRNVKKAKLKVEKEYELDLKHKGQSGSIFALKNMGWMDKQDLDVTTQGEKISTDSEVLRRFAFMLRERQEEEKEK